ncbi:hypothetical protein Salat_1194700 [Sesamum alatum]|uniref:Uncharacterized protein n=1 Tax=Sesamum alatum TaxID=300844 RepID=A0AAE1YF74_9LAMI|nr:hypothetical protein Salat_1194700 [Sesamum alatum]
MYVWQEILELFLEHEIDREVRVYLEDEIGGEVEINEKVASELNENNGDSKDSEDFLDSGYDLGREDEEEAAEAAEIERALQEAEALLSVNVQETKVSMDLSMKARKRTMTPTGSSTKIYLGSQNTNPRERPKTSHKTFETQSEMNMDMTLRRSTRLNAATTGQENATTSRATITNAPTVPGCVLRPPVPFAPGHPPVAISITTQPNKPLPPLFKTF